MGFFSDILEKRGLGSAAVHPQQLNWRTSIVDVLELIEVDSSLAARKQLATELGCPAAPPQRRSQAHAIHRHARPDGRPPGDRAGIGRQ